MKIGIVFQHAWPVPTPVHTGDVVILDLAIALHQLGHEVTCFAPAGTLAPARLCPMKASLGGSFPLAHDAEQQCWDEHRAVILEQDIIHDFSITKRIVENLSFEGRSNHVSTPLGGNWTHPEHGRNVCVWSEAMRQRALRGETDYAGTPTPDAGGPSMRPLKDAHVVYGGIDTDFYCPDPFHPFQKGDEYLWMGRWHPVRGFRMAIDVARHTGIKLVMAGEDPTYMRWDAEKQWAAEAYGLAADLPNVRFEWLKADPGHHDHKRQLYRGAKAFLLPTAFQEPFGLSQVEAMACGTVVIATLYGSMPEVSGPTGLGRENRLSEFCQGVREFDEGGCGPLDYRRCRSDAVERFDRSVMARNYVAQYEAVLRGEGWG